MSEQTVERRGLRRFTRRFSVQTQGDNVILPAGVGRFRIVHYILTSNVNTSLIWRSGGRDISGQMNVSTGVVQSEAGSWDDPLFETEPGQSLVLNLSGNHEVRGRVTAWEMRAFDP